MGALDFISNKTVCDWFYIMFIVNCIASTVMLIRLIAMIIYTKPGILLGSFTFFITIIAASVTIINGAFFYTLCNRALLSNQEYPALSGGYPTQEF